MFATLGNECQKGGPLLCSLLASSCVGRGMMDSFRHAADNAVLQLEQRGTLETNNCGFTFLPLARTTNVTGFTYLPEASHQRLSTERKKTRP
jgi:hypothetical protein